MRTLQATAHLLHRWGANVTAISRGSKQPCHTWKHWETERQSEPEMLNLPWRTAAGVGIINGVNGWRTFELDTHKDNDGSPATPISEATLLIVLGALGLPDDYPWVWRSGSGTGWEIAFLCHEAMLPHALPAGKKEAGVFWGYPPDGSDFHHAELRWERNQTICPPSAYTFGKGTRKGEAGPGYRWRSAPPTEPPTPLSVRRVINAFYTICPPPPYTLGSIDDATKAEIRRRFDLVAYAQQHLGGAVQQESGGEVRLLGHGGMLLKPDAGEWYNHSDQIGGDCFDLVGYVYYGTTVKNLNGKSAEILSTAADFTGVVLPERRSGSDSDPETTERRAAPAGVLLSEVQPEPITWLWPGRIPGGKLTVVDGDPGLGKSAMTLDWAARVSVGLPFPDGSSTTVGGVVLLSAEDGLADTIRPRLEAAGADLTRILAVTTIPENDGERLPAIPHDIPIIEHAIERVGAVLVVVDPLMAFVGSGVNTRHDHDVRRALAPLAVMAEHTGVAVVVVRHLTKSPGGSPLYRGGGSIGIIGAARSGLLVAPDPDDGERRVLASVKSNLGPPPPALAYRLEGTPTGSVRVVWLGQSDHTATKLLALRPSEEERSALDEAVDVLQGILAAGPVAADEVKRQAREAGVTEATLRRAKDKLGVRSQKVGFQQATEWVWALPQPPEDDQPAPEDAHHFGMSIFAHDEHLRGGVHPPDPARLGVPTHNGEKPKPPAGTRAAVRMDIAQHRFMEAENRMHNNPWCDWSEEVTYLERERQATQAQGVQ